MSAALDNPIFADADKAREHLEAQRWPNGATCPHCGNADPERITGLKGKAHRPGLYQCAECREQFTGTVGTVFERSKIPLNKWMLAVHLMTSSKKGISAHQIHRMLGVTYKTAWFMCHRIREAMADESPEPMGGEGQIVEAAKTFHKGLIEHINSQTFPTPDAAQSMLAAGELGDALSGFLRGLEQMMEDSGRFPKG